ncbi:hypothetical protein V8G54_023541, partial [Vigna mungo]
FRTLALGSSKRDSFLISSFFHLPQAKPRSFKLLSLPFSWMNWSWASFFSHAKFSSKEGFLMLFFLLIQVRVKAGEPFFSASGSRINPIWRGFLFAQRNSGFLFGILLILSVKLEMWI